MRPEIDVYQMPAHLGGDWAWAAAGVISDGYGSEAEARVAALWYLDGLGELVPVVHVQSEVTE